MHVLYSQETLFINNIVWIHLLLAYFVLPVYPS